MLVSNLGQTEQPGTQESLRDYDVAQPFTTGTNAAGYTLTSIELRLEVPTSGTTPTAPTVKLYSGSATGTEVATLTGPATLDAAVKKDYTFTPSSIVGLSSSTTYWVVAENTNSTVTQRFYPTDSDAEDATSATGWSISNTYERRDDESTGSFTEYTTLGALMIRVNGSALNTPPDAADGTVTTNEDTAYAFSAADFNFSDADGDALEVEIVELPVAGTLKLDNANASVADLVSEADIDAGLFTYTPPANANGTGYASFDFAVDDGTIGSPAYTMTINVTAVNDLPSGKPVITGTATVGQALSASASGISDVDGLSGVTYSYQWVRVDGSDSDISGATSSTYTLQSADGGRR